MERKPRLTRLKRRQALLIAAYSPENLVLDLVLTSAHLTAPEGTEAGHEPRFSPQMDLLRQTFKTGAVV
jgi:hypothetical protein